MLDYYSIPLFEKDGYIICFEALPETEDIQEHFVKECGWSKEEATMANLKHLAWFQAKVSAWKNGKELGASYLGCCAYDSPTDFFTIHAEGYFKNMVDEAIEKAREAEAK